MMIKFYYNTIVFETLKPSPKWCFVWKNWVIIIVRTYTMKVFAAVQWSCSNKLCWMFSSKIFYYCHASATWMYILCGMKNLICVLYPTICKKSLNIQKADIFTCTYPLCVFDTVRCLLGITIAKCWSKKAFFHLRYCAVWEKITTEWIRVDHIVQTYENLFKTVFKVIFQAIYLYFVHIYHF